jgi:hypothetical protein
VAFAFDIFGSTSVWYAQFDGTNLLPFKSQGQFHFGGKIVVSPLDLCKKTEDSVIPILSTRQNVPCLIVFVPPLPRYLFARCYSDASHCTNICEKDFGFSY